MTEATAGDKIAKKDDLERLQADFNEKVKEAESNSIKRYLPLKHVIVFNCSSPLRYIN